jgi:hypothetical protein
MLRSCAWLTLIIIFALLVAIAIVGSSRGAAGIAASAVAAGVCWIGSMAALVVTGLSSRSNHAVQGHLLGMFFRLGLPLVAGIAIKNSGGTLAQAGTFGLIVVFYLIALVTETVLSLRLIKRPPNVTRGL